MRLKLLLIFLTLFTSSSFFAQCGPTVPGFTVNLTGNPSGTWTSPLVQRNGNCCGTTAPDKCVNFVITLDPAAVGINFNIIAGAIPGGALFYQINCGPQTPLGSPICLTGPGPHLLTFCKPGNNENIYQISSIPPAIGGTNIVVNDGCIDTLHATGFNTSTVTWNSIYPGTPGAYNNLLSCTSQCLNPIVTGAGSLPPYIDYVVCGQPASLCNFATTCDTVRVTFNPTLSVSIAPLNPTICFGQTATTITATGNGGTPPYSYLWNSVNPSQSINVGTGNYTVQLTDASGCPPAYNSVTVTSFSVAITANAGPDQTLCSQSTPHPVLNGSVTGASGGVWSGGGGTYSPNNATLNATYTPTPAEIANGFVDLTLTTTGNGTCPAMSDVVRINFTGWTGTVAVTPTNVSCAGGNNGSAVVAVTGGSPPFTYLWNTVPAQTTATASNLSQGTYSVTVTNSLGCIFQTTTTITQPLPLASSNVITHVSCAGGNNGTISVTPSGGTPPYSYSWSPGGFTTSTITGLTAGTYSVTITDSKGCVLPGTYTVTQPLPLGVTVTKTNVSCNGGSDGTASAAVTGGTAPYTYAWTPTGGTASNAGGLIAGTYTVTVTDSKGCVITATTTITQPTPLVATTTVVNETCDYLNNGSATGNVSGGTPPYTYQWQPGGGATQTINGLASGTYTLTATDSKGCSILAFATITQPPVLLVSLINQTNVSCFAGSNGSLTASPTGGTSAYTYLWSPGGSTSATLSGATAGTYSVTVTDANGCQTQSQATITQPFAPLSVTNTITNVSCAGGSNGSVSVTPAGGTSPYTYLWAPGGQNTATISGQAAGTYSVTVTDFNGCTLSASYTITQPLPLAITFTQTNVSCFNGSNGSATANVTGGTTGYTYSWSPSGGTSSTASGLIAGTYTVTVTDALGCIATNSVIITQPTQLLASTTVANETCDYLNNGSATAVPSGGTPGYTYLWQPGGQTTSTINGLAAGTYSVTITDALGCSASATAVINQPAPLAIAFNSQVNVSCFGGSDGSVSATPSGGTPNYTYLWMPGGATTNTASGLSAGTYTLTITDANGCTFQNTVVITQPVVLSVTSTIGNVSCNGGSNGTITAIPAGGTAPFNYQWLPGGQSSATITGQVAGTYTVTVTDALGCQITASYTITEPLPLAIAFTAQNVSCFGGSNGTINSTVSGGTPPFTYSWNPTGSVNPNVSGLTAGTYTLTVTDALGCVFSSSQVITEPTLLTVSITSTDETCDYANNGTATAAATGGTAGYSYSWQPGSMNSGTVTNLASGTYTVTATDNLGCTATSTVVINQPPPLAITYSGQIDVSCFGGNDGSVSATPSGGTPNYSYLWSPGGATTNSVSGLSAGTYSLTITDANGCTFQNTVTIVQPALPLSVSGTSTPTSCFEGSDGTANATAAGGTSPYSYSWMPVNIGTQSISGVLAGTYTVTATDSKGCIATNTIVIAQPPQLILTTSTFNSNCGLATGSASVVVSGGFTPYTYSWSPSGGNAATATNLLAGPYTVTVTDNNGCIETQWANVNDNSGPNATIFNVINVTCFGGNDGSASVGVAGGTGPFTYNWTPYGGNTVTANGLVAGTYTVTVIDANGCESNATTSPDIMEPPPIVISTSTSDVSCFGGNDGTASAVATGGTPGYTYQWLPGGTIGPNVSNLSLGTYTVQVTDNNSCIQTTTYSITQPAAALAVSVASTPVSCNTGSNGTVSANATGGTGPYNYNWMPGNIAGQNLSNLPSGTYTVTVVDAEGCSATNSISIVQPTPIVLATSSINSNCSLPNGQASVNASGGTPGYTYFWTPGGQTGATATGLMSGTYSVTVTDLNGCTATTSVVVNDNPGPSVSVSSVTSVSCFGGSNGTATATVTGGTGPFSYTWSPSGGTNATATGLIAGTYTVIATDANGCPSIPAVSPMVTQPTLVIVNVSTNNVSCLGGNNGSATATVFGGTPGYTYLWLPSGSTGASISGLAAGTYTVQVTDANSCVQTSTYTITQPAAALSVVAATSPVSCFGGSNGSASSNANGGTAPYNYSWMPGSVNGQFLGGLPIGTYTVTATDSKGCIATTSTTVTQPTQLVLTTSSNNASCGAASGVASVTVTGGTPTYAYQWFPAGGTNATATSVLPGTYTVTVTDNNSCVSTASVMVNNNPGPVASVASSTNVSCFGGSDGTATAGVSSGSAPFGYSWSPSGGTNSTATGLAAGTYSVTITDANGCIATSSGVVITQPTQVNVNVTTTDVSCLGGNDGTAAASAGGGTPGYTFLWLPSNTVGATISSLSAGTYTVQVSDSKSCTQSTTYTINQPTQLMASISASSNVSCFGGNNGSATVTASGATPFYTYNWLPYGGTGQTATGLVAGNYTVTVTDAEGCSTTATASITQPAQALGAVANGTSTSCFSGSDGVANVFASGGTPGYAYLWTPIGGTNSTATGLPAGNYAVLVTDANGCQTNASATITQPTAVTASLSTVEPSCGFNNGSATSLVSGGTGPYTYLWSPGGATTANISGIGPGLYTLQITDANSCVMSVSATLTNIAGPVTAISSVTNVSCFGGSNGSATVAINSGSAPYTMSWSPFGGNTITGTGLTAGTYTVTVTDSLGCISTSTATITEPTQVGISVSALTNVSCFGGGNGSITVTGTGGTSPYTYSWSPITSTSPTVTGLSADSYTVNVLDQNNCATSITVNITEPQTLISSIGSTTSPTCYNSSNGTATVNASGGTIPYSYLWSNNQTGSTAVNLVAGSYSVTVTDANGCTTNTSLVLTQPTPVITTGGPNDTICLGSSGSLSATASGGAGNYYYVWQPGPSINAGTLNVTPLVNEEYIVVAYDQDGCPGRPDTVSAIVYNLTSANVNALAFSPICPGQVTTIYAQTFGITGPLTFSWNNGLGTGPGAFVITPVAPTTYIVAVTNSCGATIYDSVDVTFSPPPTLAMSSDTNTICVPDVVQFMDNSVSGNIIDPITSWLWNFGDGSTSTLQNPTHTYPYAGTYPVTLTVTTGGGCTNNNATAPIMINAYPYPVAAFSLNSTSFDLPYDPLIATNQSVGASTYLWNFGDGGTSTAANPTYLYTTVGIYPVQLIATSSLGCSDTAFAEIITNADVVFPNVFTPDPENPSGGYYDITSLTNDVFFPYTSGVTDFKLQIFNRWGELIFETFDIKQGWDGYYRGQLCQQDVYIWKAYVKLNNGKEFNKTGDVTLLR